MSEYKSEKVYLHYVDGAPILVDSLGMRIGVQGRLDLIGDAGGFHSAVVKLEIDGKWSQEVANEFVSAGGRPVVKKDVCRDSAYEYLHRFGLQDFKVINGQDGIEMEIECMSSPDFVTVNGKKYLQDGARGDNGNPDPVKPVEADELIPEEGIKKSVVTDVERILFVGVEKEVDAVMVSGEKFVRESSQKAMVGDFNRLLELFPEIARAMADQRGMTIGGLRAASANGNISFKDIGIAASRLAVRPQNAESKLSVEVDTSAIDQAIKRIEDAQEAFWKSQVAHGAVSIAGEVADFGPFPTCPLESAISETVRHLREELQASGARSSDFPIGAYARLDAHLDELLRAQIDKVVK